MVQFRIEVRKDVCYALPFEAFFSFAVQHARHMFALLSGFDISNASQVSEFIQDCLNFCSALELLYRFQLFLDGFGCFGTLFRAMIGNTSSFADHRFES